MKLTKGQQKKKDRGLCVSRCCMNTRREGSNFCHKHNNRRYRANNPERYAFHTLKDNAKRRGHFFDLTYEDFLAFLKSHPNYMANKGRKSSSIHIDRIDINKGYTLSNLQTLTNRENVQKQHNEDYCPF
jgi:hypothetical protein